MVERHPPTRLIVGPGGVAGATLALSPEEAAHARARRLRPGDAVTLVDGTGLLARGRLLSLTRSGAEVAVEAVESAGEPGPPIALLAAAVRLERLSWIVEKATELAARRVVLVSTERTQSFRAPESLRQRLTRVAREAAKQSRTALWPALEGPWPLEHVLSTEQARHRLLLDPGGDVFPSTLSGSISLLVGPEGGWTDAERTACRAAGWVCAALPAGNLRAETAAVAALVLARAALERESAAAR